MAYIGDTVADDILYGTLGADTIVATWGNDTVWAGQSHDTVWGGVGHDTLYGQGGNDWLDGEAGDDLLYGGSGNNYLLGRDGNDQLISNIVAGYDRLYGGSGDDVLIGGTELYGDAGRDRLIGGATAGSSVLIGGAGRDQLRGGAGFDTLAGGTGSDTYFYRVNDGFDQIEEYGNGGIADRLVIQSTEFASDRLTVTLTGNDIILGRLYDDRDQIRLVNQFNQVNTEVGIERIDLTTEGLYLTKAELNTLVEAMVVFAQDNGIDLSQQAQVIADTTLMSMIASAFHA